MRVVGRFAAPAPDVPPRENNRLPSEIDTLFVAWGSWSRSRRYFGAPKPMLGSTLGPLRIKSTAPSDGPGIKCSPELALLHRAVMALPERDQMILQSRYVFRLTPAIEVARALGVSRVHYYRLLNGAATRAHAAHLAMLREPV